MQAQQPSQRGFSQRRNAGDDQGPGSKPPNRPASPPGIQARASTASVKSSQAGSQRRSTREGSGSSVPLSQIEKSVTHLLVATKQLLETLTQWSRGQATDTQVSDVYVRLGYEFNMACRAFTAINVDTSDLGNVPDLLRNILEATLSQEASAESLERYLPRIRDIIINLLHGLKRKQQRLRQRQGRERDANGLPERTTSVVSTATSASSGLTTMLDEGIENGYQQDGRRPSDPRSPPNVNTSPSRRFNASREASRNSVQSEQSSATGGVVQSAPQLPPYPGEDSFMPAVPSGELNIESFPPPPPPPPEPQSSALAALQKGGDLERRASRRYSQYQISKHLGGANGVPILPPQNSPVPNRGRREARESMHAVQKRESVRHSRNPSNQSKASSSPMRVPAAVAEESATAQPAVIDSPTVQTPEDKYAPSATVSGPISEPVQVVADPKAAEVDLKVDTKADKQSAAVESKQGESYFQVSPPPTPTKDLTLFLQYKSKVKKMVFPDGRDELSIGRLQLAFIEKFSWNTQHNGSDLPEIYIQDPVSGVRHELEDLSDVRDRTVLVLNVEALDEVKRHIDDGLLGITKIVQEVKDHVSEQAATLQKVSDKQQDTADEVNRLAAAPPVAVQSADGSRAVVSGPRLGSGHAAQIQIFRRDLAILRQTYTNFQSDMDKSMSTIRQKASTIKSAASKASLPDMEADAGYTYVKSGRKKLNVDSDRLVGKVDDLQDLIEDLRKDVVHRGVRPLPRLLEGVSKDLSDLGKELKRMEDYMSEEKPIWTKIWEKELEDVCQGRDELRLMEDLMVDLRDDLEKASETFTLVEQATKEQMKDNGTSASAGAARQFSKGLNNLGNSADQGAAKEDVLGEVRALMPNHEDRLEAIERAEKLRQKELEGRQGNPLLHELSSFVQSGKLKKSGGYEEVERARIAKDERIRREVWERMNGIIAEVEGEFDEDEEEEEEEEEEYQDAEDDIPASETAAANQGTNTDESAAARKSGSTDAIYATNKE